MRQANIICVNNGVGLSQDRQIIRRLLERDGWAVTYSESQQPMNMRKRYDLNIFCEQVHHQYIGLAKKNVLIPNPEWFFEAWTKQLYRFDGIFCKTKDCQRIFSSIASEDQLVYTSFTSEDRYIEGVKKEREFSHFAGKSSHKGTLAIVTSAIYNKLPKINVYVTPSPNQIKFTVNPTKVVMHTQRIHEEQFRLLQNRSMFHLCPSEYEGWGHYINEAKSVGAIIITTNAAPMNELVTSEFGFGAAYSNVTSHHLAPTYKVDVMSLAESIRLAADIDDDTAKELSRKARKSFVDNDEYFTDKFITEINKIAK